MMKQPGRTVVRNNVIPFTPKNASNEKFEEIGFHEWKVQSEQSEVKTSISIVSSGFGSFKEKSANQASMSMVA